MKNLFIISLLLALAFSEGLGQDADGRIITGRSGFGLHEAYMEGADLSDYHHASEEAFEAFRDMKYGVRIHWGIYSHFYGESWILKRKDPKNPERWNDLQEPDYMGYYHQIYKSWYPEGFDADRWAGLFADNGFKFFVFTTKHHDGFTMYDTRYRVKKTWDFFGEDAGRIIDCDLKYSIMETPFARDVTAELVEACRGRSLKVGLYFSHPDWFDADFRLDWNNPYLDTTYSPLSNPEAWQRFTSRHTGQIRELLSNYGQVDMISLDMNFQEVAWPHMQEMIREVREIQPDCMFRWRGIGNYGDYQTPESYIPGDEDKGTMPWQVIHPLSSRKNFSYEPDPDLLYDGSWIVENLVDIVSKGGNFMVGIGPDNAGRYHPKVIEALEYAGAWLAVNGEAIYATRPWKEYKEGDGVRFTRSKDGRTLYAHVLHWPGHEFTSKLVHPEKGSEVHMLGVDEALEWKVRKGDLHVRIPEEFQKEENRPCKQVYTFRFRLNQE